MMKVRIDVVEDEPVVMERLLGMLESSNQFSPGFSCSTIKSAKEHLNNFSSKVLLLDLGLPDGSGIEILEFIKKQELSTDVIVISSFSNEKTILKAVSAGAVGFIHKDEEYQEITVSISQMLKGGSPISPGIARHLLNTFKSDLSVGRREGKELSSIKLTKRETDILQKISKGYTCKEISNMESVSYHTVATHIRNIYKKLSVSSRAEALFEAYNMGLI